MLISQAFAQDTPPVPETTSETAVPGDTGTPMPSTQNILVQNVAMIVLLVFMFYFLLIRPQQKRFKEHKLMIDALVSRNVIDPHGRNARSKTSNNAAMLPDTRPLP